MVGQNDIGFCRGRQHRGELVAVHRLVPRQHLWNCDGTALAGIALAVIEPERTAFIRNVAVENMYADAKLFGGVDTGGVVVERVKCGQPFDFSNTIYRCGGGVNGGHGRTPTKASARTS